MQNAKSNEQKAEDGCRRFVKADIKLKFGDSFIRLGI